MELVEIAIMALSFSMSMFALIVSFYNGNDLRDLERKVDRLKYNDIDEIKYEIGHIKNKQRSNKL